MKVGSRSRERSRERRLVARVLLAAALTPYVLEGEEPRSFTLQPVSGADGRFDTVEVEGREVYRAFEEEGSGYALYLYLRAPPEFEDREGTFYVEIDYLDVGRGKIGIQYNAKGGDAYRRARTGHGTLLQDTGRHRTAVFRLSDAALRGAQNLGADLRITSPDRGARLHITGARIFTEPPESFTARSRRPWLKPYEGPRRSDIDARTLHGKVICGYQGWFRCPGDGTEEGWVHWSRSRSRITPETLTIDMWPDMSEYSEEEKYPAPGFTYPGGRQAHLFSSANPRTVERHFDWMRRYGIDGVEIQRFVVHLGDPPDQSRVLGYARRAANRTGRVFNVGYDLSGTAAPTMVDLITRDWDWLAGEMKITEDPRYLRHEGKPVLAVFGFFPERFGGDPSVPNRLIDYFQRGQHPVTLIGGCPWYWRRIETAGWPELYRRFDVIRPWNVGNTSTEDGRRHASVGYWGEDLEVSKTAGMVYMPVLYPGFSWDNLKQKAPGASAIPRLGGDFLWRQFHAAASLGITTCFVAMFDEVDEGTAIFKVTSRPPREAHFVTYEGFPSDWYLRLTGAGTRMVRGEAPRTRGIPFRP